MAGSDTNQVYLGGRGGMPDNVGSRVSHKMFAPRLGLAYRLDDKTVIRTGYGINYDPLPFSRPLRGFYPLDREHGFDLAERLRLGQHFDAGHSHAVRARICPPAS